MPDIPDKRPVPVIAIAYAVDALAWALCESLIKKGIIKADDLVAQLDPALQEVRSSGPIKIQDNTDPLATLLAIERLVKAIQEIREND